MDKLLFAAQTHLRSAFQGKKSKRLSLFILDLLIVAHQLRPCFLNDYFFADPDEVSRFLDAIRSDQQFAALRCLMLGEDSFFYNINSSFADVELGRLVYINVEAQAKIPQFAGVLEAGIIQDTFNSILNAMRTANNSDLLVVRIQSWSRSPIITSISGILLGYPVIYTFGMNAAIPTTENTSNCLADCSLEVYKVFGSVSEKVQRNLGLTNMDHLIMSFSIPSHLLNDDDSPDYVALLESRFSSQNSDPGLFTRISVERSSTILPCVVV